MTQQRKIALVTGGSRGLGKNMALKIAEKGLDVVLTYHSKQEEASEVVEQIKAKGVNAAAFQLDTSKVGTMDDFVTALVEVLKADFNADGIDFIVNNAGIGIYAPFAETSEEQFDQLMNIQLKGVYFLTQKVLPLLRNDGGIINISTGLARFALPGYSAYAAMKGGIEVLTRYQAKELGARGIRANTVAPGAIETDFGGGMVRDNQEVNQHIASTIPLGRAGLPDDIGGVVAFLCTEDARWVNAQRIEVSGGQNI
uniref:SDR family oxidoreductase n=1 Tax=Roseihalotalea indica TaxID=2867963 RepID=A0AA49JF93_9BACT|nr:SDR family oxidoreductase [Tunicatimonas sp. TK19036]